MKQRLIIILPAFLIVIILAAFLFVYNYQNSFFTPPKKHNHKWRIGYYEGGSWVDYQGNLVGIVHGLMELGELEKASLPDLKDTGDTGELWRWLSNNVKGRQIEFVSDAYWSSAWQDDLRKQNRNEALNRLANGTDIDLMIAAGTWAGQDLAVDGHTVPTIVISASNPIQSGIIKSVEDSGFNHVFAKVDPERYIRQLRLFHALTKFNRLGIIYENTVEGRSYAALEEADKVAGEKGFKVITCQTNFANLSLEKAEAGTLRCVEELAPQIDAFYITDHRGQTLEHMDEILKILLQHRIPTWAQSGSEFVKRGALFSTTKVEYDEYGLFYAKVIVGLCKGEKLRDFSQVFEDPKRLAVNATTAKIIGYDIPPSLLNNATVYTSNTEYNEGD